MPKRGKLLSVFEQGQINAFIQDGIPVKEIAARLNRSFNCIQRYKRSPNGYLFSSGRPISLNERDKRRISQEMVKNDAPSLRKLASCLDIKVSHETIRKFLNTNGWKYVPAIKAPKLTEEHMSKRKSWAKSTLIDMSLQKLDLQKITFSDEKRFLLDGPDCCRYYWMQPNSAPKFFGKKVFSPGLTVWGGIGYNGTTSLYVTESTINSDVYINILTQSYLPFHHEGYILMQDNAKPHISQKTKEFLQQQEINLLNWPSCSPDCNPIENLWGILVQRLYAGGRQFTSINQLKQSLLTIWDSVTLQEIRNLVESFPSRLVDVSAANGGNISHY